ncbi:2-octaprenylphenol hydroxylase [Bathymodiolus platifrons methanotrophic gill symbiont]|uniref:UbiH/UbiF/VisC/COQ6 family ubiquinone biosynthesis hydroxylase n=1 Tax=Bathymodiolus platifrons methanotrophic gill symbiont TaxID=113268 RepID=UPI0011CB8B98|nr:UbiH/UbiF/VisC/COQ6 family ubiquinone biosynthesis hydroxylase [Bathymodiolus platifrons methanotrophic gill symbiont]MCK5871017.1 UbiH/UbiF/VisC/COQ6 family ubiquinone biosynthesis hydroxylase [Methyloprofundus sp.]TXK94226.1 ubiquinone biosynthesis protein UbiH [Methylococcaceae bacterium CS4]TXK98516.1 ubiquinone biosynthesis protein UbiH [Methylococcaceae bacterium CS5]TXL02046.1 ubiquinone biosynthesis protein UbiH [Methylococcaceae bacterium HT1]TXL05574.1 ubiquinone biosynthesis prot
MSKKYPVVVVGGGIVGATAACAIAQAGIEVALVDVYNPAREWPADPVDIRVSALTRASQNILQAVGAWPAMEQRGVGPYGHMHVWDADSAGVLDFDAAETEFSELGHLVENRVTVASLWDRLEALPSASLLCPAKVADIQIDSDSAQVVLDDGQILIADVLIAADGRDSALRQMAGIQTTGWEYKQDGLVATISTEKSHQYTAWQRFLPEGPLAFLPLKNGQCSIVWTLSHQTAQEYVALSDKEFLQHLEQASGGVLGKMLEVGPRGAFPLRFQYAKQYTTDHFVLIGDAAHAMHPLAGQGANAGLLDAAAIAELIVKAQQAGRPIGSHKLLRQYERWRKGDNLAMMSSMDMINKMYTAQNEGFRQLRGTGMSWINHSAWIKNYFNHYAMGLRDDLPTFARSCI